MHMQPMYRMNPFVVRDGDGRTQTRDCLDGESTNVGADIFTRGLCLPSDNKITPEEQDQIIEIIRGCFDFRPERPANSEQRNICWRQTASKTGTSQLYDRQTGYDFTLCDQLSG